MLRLPFVTIGCRLFGLLASLLLLASSVALVGCSVDTADGDYPEGDKAITFGRAVLGGETRVNVSRSRSESKPCSLESGEFGPWIDCDRHRDLAARFTLIECLPKTACRDVAFDGAKGSFVSLASVFEVHTVADIEGERVEVTRTMNALAPKREIQIRPEYSRGRDDALLERRVVVACTGAGSDGLALDGFVWSAMLDGEALEAVKSNGSSKSNGSTSQSCFAVRPDHAGTVRFTLGLASPAIEVGSASARIRGFDEVDAIILEDTFCPSSKPRSSESASIVGAYPYKGSWYIHVTGELTLRDGGRAYLPAEAARFVDGENVQPLTEAGAGLSLLMPAEPSGDARIEIVLGDRTMTLPVVVGTCS